MESKKPSRNAGRGISAKKVTAEIPLPEPGQTLTFEITRYNLTVLVERGEAETQEQIRSKYAVVSPVAPDRRLHAARIGVGAVKGRRLSTTLCSQELPPDKAISSGARVDILLDVTTCGGCIRILKAEGVELKGETT